MKKILTTLLTLHASLFTLHVSEAQIINVPADQPTIQAGINAATNGDTVLVADGTYLENINFNGKAITVASHFIMYGDTNHINNTIIDGSQPDDPDYSSVVTFITAEDTTSVLCGFTITGGTGTYIALDEWRLGGGIVCYYASAKICNNRIMNNTVIDSNEAAGGGIGCYSEIPGSWAVIKDNTISANTCSSENAAGGGGIFSSYNSKITSNIIENNLVSGIISDAMGGGVFTQNSSSQSDTVYILNNTIRHNSAYSNDLARGGGIFCYGNYLIMRDNIIRHDSLSGDRTNGGAANLLNTVYTEIANNIVTENIVNKITSYWGTGIFCVGPQGPVKVLNNEFSFNTGEPTSTGAGGGFSIIDAFDYPILVDGNHFLSNIAYHGGGFYARNCYNLLLTNNMFVENDSYRGGAIGLFHGAEGSSYRPLIINNTFFSNSASNDAGAVRFTGEFMSAPLIMNCIFWENEAPDGNDVRNWSTDPMHVYYSDIDTNMIVGPWSGDFNFYEDPAFADDYFHIDPSSPCYDTGTDSLLVLDTWYYSPDYDFEGSQRPFNNGVDMGADEWDNIGFAEFNPPAGGQHSEFRIEVYPNPGQGIFNFRFSIFDGRLVTVKVYDVHGREVATLLDDKLPAGEHHLQFDASGLPSEIYFIRLTTAGHISSRKVIKVH